MCAKRVRGIEQLEKKKYARIRFRTLIRRVMFNRNWLADQDNQKLTLNVMKNIAMLVRPKQKVGILTMSDKALIQTPHASRSVGDRKALLKLLLGLLCFTRFPPKVVARLVPSIKYMLLERGRTVMREGDPPSMVFFLLTGEIQVSKKVFNTECNAYVDKIEFIASSGDCIGDTEVLEDCKRLRTYITTMEAELLYLYLDDFQQVLYPFMYKQWEEKKAVIKSLPYFKHFKEDQVITGIHLSVVRQFESFETIYAEDKGQLSFAYFVFSGDCVILQCLKMNVTERYNVKTFDLVDISKDDNARIENEELTSAYIKKKMIEEQLLEIKSEHDYILSDDEEKTEKRETLKMKYYEEVEDVYRKCGLLNHINGSIEEEEAEEEEEDSLLEFEDENETGANSEYTKRITEQISTMTLDRKSERKYSNDRRSNSKMSNFSLKRFSKKQNRIITRLENRVIDVGSIISGGMFGIGEEMKHRVVVASTTVQCLMIPRFWLLQKEQNPGNIWSRRRYYLDATIPSRDKLFKDFLSTRQWSQFKNNLIHSVVRQHESNPTKPQDIPIMLHLED